MKRIESILLTTLLVGYLIFSIVVSRGGAKRADGEICQYIRVVTDSGDRYNLVDVAHVEDMLQKRGYKLVGLPMGEINTLEIEQWIGSMEVIREAICYKTSGGGITICLKVREPILRVVSSRGDSYYVDREGEILRTSLPAISLPLVTGEVTERIAQQELLQVVQIIDKSKFWSAQIQQINVTKEGNIELVPRVGSHLLLLGKAESIEEKLDRLYRFYHKGLNVVGWNKYKSVSVEYSNQIVCKRR